MWFSTTYKLTVFFCFHERYFHVCDGGLIPDIMHDILEGALQYEIKLMIKIMVEVKQYFTLGKHKLIPVSFIKLLFPIDLLNTRLTNTELGYMEASDKCSLIDATTLFSNGHTLRQSGTYVNRLTHAILCK